ncbi:phosphatidylinositol-4-phosphate 5-kinase-like [Lotmaria passim]
MNPKQEERKCSSECAAPLCTPSGDVSAASGKTNCDDSPLRRLRRENHLLRLQLLKLREQQHSLLHQVAAGGLLSSNGATPTTEIVYGTVEPPHIAATLGVDAGPACSRADLAEESTNDEAAALRARTLLRQEARQQRITPARAILASAGQAGLAAGPAPPNQQPPLEPSNETEALQRETVPPTARTGRGQSPPPAKDRTPSETVPPVPTDAEGDMSAQAMRQRFQSRKAQRRLRLEQMLGPSCEDAPRCLSSLPEDGPLSHATSSNNSDAMLGTGTLLSNAAALEGTSDASGGGGAAAVSHCAARTSETTSGATAAPAGPTQNPNQIGRAVTDAVKNNSWYLCKVLEAALLDTIQARRVLQDSPPSRTSAPVSLVSQPAPAQSGKTGEAAERGSNGAATPKAMQSLPSAATTTPTTTAAPPFLYQLGVSDTALRRAIEESLVLAFRCIHDAPQRLTSQQAAEEAVPPFEAENKDDELRRCFAGHAGRHSAERNGGASENSTEDENGGGPSTAEADDDTLDPFARLLLARISAELPSKSAKMDKKHKEHHGGSSSGSVTSDAAAVEDDEHFHHSGGGGGGDRGSSAAALYSGGGVATVLIRPSTSAVRVLHQHAMATLEPADVLAAVARTSPAAYAVGLGLPFFDFAYGGGMRVVDAARCVWEVRGLAASAGPKVVYPDHPRTYKELLRELVSAHYSPHRLPRAAEMTYASEQLRECVLYVEQRSTGWCPPLVRRLRELSEPFIRAAKLLRTDVLAPLEEAAEATRVSSIRPVCFGQLANGESIRYWCAKDVVPASSSASEVAATVSAVANEPHVLQHVVPSDAAGGVLRYPCNGPSHASAAEVMAVLAADTATAAGSDSSALGQRLAEAQRLSLLCVGGLAPAFPSAYPAASSQSLAMTYASTLPPLVMLVSHGCRWLPPALQPPQQFSSAYDKSVVHAVAAQNDVAWAHNATASSAAAATTAAAYAHYVTERVDANAPPEALQAAVARRELRRCEELAQLSHYHRVLTAQWPTNSRTRRGRNRYAWRHATTSCNAHDGPRLQRKSLASCLQCERTRTRKVSNCLARD